MKYKIFFFLLFITSFSFAQTDKKLTIQLQDAIKGFNGQVGVYVQNLKTGKTAEINPDSLLYPGEDILGSFKDKDTIELSKVVLLMITMSDNTASTWLQKIVTGEYINNWLEQNGFKVMRVNSRVKGREQIRVFFLMIRRPPRE